MAGALDIPAVLALQRATGNRATTTVIARSAVASGIIRRNKTKPGESEPTSPGKGYVICEAGDVGDDGKAAAETAKDSGIWYVWRNALPPGAEKAKLQPFSWYTLYEDVVAKRLKEEREREEQRERDRELSKKRREEQEERKRQQEEERDQKEKDQKQKALDKKAKKKELAKQREAEEAQKKEAERKKQEEREKKELEKRAKLLEEAVSAARNKIKDTFVALEKSWPSALGERGAAELLQVEQLGQRSGSVKAINQFLLDLEDYSRNVESIGVLGKEITEPHLTSLLDEWKGGGARASGETLEAVLDFAREVGRKRLSTLMTDWRVPATALKKYGPEMAKGFVGCTDALWEHLTTISHNKDGAITGGHDWDLFEASQDKEDYKITATIREIANVAKKVRYETGSGAIGSKTLLKGLKANEKDWRAQVSFAAWEAYRTEALPVGGGAFATRDLSRRPWYGYFNEVTGRVATMWPDM